MGYLKALEREDIEFWTDRRITTSELWDNSIRQQIESADIALVLVSQAFLTSRYCQDVEIAGFLNQQKLRGLRIFPVILRACDWRSHEWLRATQFQPSDGRSLESDFRTRAKREELFLKILEDLRKVAEDIRVH